MTVVARRRPRLLSALAAAACAAPLALAAPAPAAAAGGPTVTIDAPAANAAVCGGSVAASATPTPDQGTLAPVTGVDFTFAGGAPVTTTGPYSTTWDSTKVSDGAATITATASDANGPGPTTSEQVTVVNSPHVSVSSPTSGQTVGDSVAVSTGATYLGVAVTGVSASVGGETPVALSSGGGVFSGSVPVSDLHGSQTLTLSVAIGSCSATQTVPITVTHPPQVSFSNPASGATVSGSVSLTAAAAATGGRTITGVSFYLDDTSHLIAAASLGSGSSTSGTWNATWNTLTASDASHTILVVATDNQSVTTQTSEPVTVSNGADSVSISTPTNGSTVSGTVTITATATTGGATLSSLILMDGATTLQTCSATPCTFGWSTAGKNGDHTLTAKVTDSFGRTATSTGVLVHVANLPTASVTAPANGSTVKGPVQITVAATADASTTVKQVQVKLDGNVLGLATATGTPGQYSLTWDSTSVPDNPHAITATVTDGKGLTSVPSTVTVAVNNGPDPVSISAPANGSTVSGTVTITATASTGAATVSQLVLKVGTTTLHTFVCPPTCSAPFTYDWSSAGFNGNQTLSATVTDSANHTGSAAIAVTVANLPTAAVTSPAAGDTVSGLALPIRIRATADGSTHVASVSVLLDGAPLASAAPEAGSDGWVAAWDTSGANGSHTLRAHVTDANGLTRDSDPVAITVANPGPSVGLPNLPEGGAVARGQVSEPIVVSPNAATGKAITSVTAVADDGANVIVTPAGAGHWTASWNTSYDLGPHVFTVKATDAGHVVTALTRHVIVTADDLLNLTVPPVRQFGQRFTVGATLRLSDGSALNNRTVRLQIRPSGARSWSALGLAKTDAHGVAAFSVTLTRAAQFRADFGGEAGVRPITSADTDVKIAPVVTLRIPITAKLGHTNRGTVVVTGPKGTVYVIQLIARKGRSATSLGSARVAVGRVTPIHLRISQHGTYVIRVSCSAGRGQPTAMSNAVTVRA